jgi:hypothetical protein
MKNLIYRKRETWLVILLASVFASHLPMQADAASILLDAIPSIRLEESWNSNVYNASTDKVSSLGTRVTPTLAFKFTSPDNVTLQLSGSYDKIWYNKSEAKDAESDTWYFRIESTGGWRLTPTLSFLPSVYYVNTTNSYRRTQLVPSGDPLLPPVSIANNGNTKSQEFGGGLRFAYLVSPNLTLGVGGTYGEQRFPSDNVAGTGLTNSTTAGGEVSVSYLISPRTTVGVLVAGSHQTFEDSPDSDTYTAGFIYGYQFSPGVRLDTTVGGQHIRQKSGPGTSEENRTSPSGIFTLSYVSETFRGSVYGSGTYAGGSGFGESTRQATVGLGFSDQITREWSWDLTAAYQISKSVFTSNAVDLRSTYASAVLRDQIWKWGSLDLTGNLNRQTSSGQFGETLNSYSVLLGITIGQPYKIY